MKAFEHLKKKWNIESNYDLVMIMIVFSLAGMTIPVFRKPIFHLLGINDHTHLWVKIVAYIPLIPPIYQLNLLFWGFVLGQFNFFWEKEKRLVRFLRGAFTGARAQKT
jgi:hypothetical protein